MTAIHTLPALMADATGQDEFLVRRILSELTDAGFLPHGANIEVAQPEVGTLLFALAAARSPSEAVDCLTAHLAAPLRHAEVTIDGQQHVLTLEQYVQFAATAGISDATSAPEWFAHVLTPRDERTDAHQIDSTECRAEIGCGAESAFSSLKLRMNRAAGAPWELFVMFGWSPEAASSTEFATVRKIGNGVFASLTAALCGADSLYRMEDAAEATMAN